MIDKIELNNYLLHLPTSDIVTFKIPFEMNFVYNRTNCSDIISEYKDYVDQDAMYHIFLIVGVITAMCIVLKLQRSSSKRIYQCSKIFMMSCISVGYYFFTVDFFIKLCQKHDAMIDDGCDIGLIGPCQLAVIIISGLIFMYMIVFMLFDKYVGINDASGLQEIVLINDSDSSDQKMIDAMIKYVGKN